MCQLSATTSFIHSSAWQILIEHSVFIRHCSSAGNIVVILSVSRMIPVCSSLGLCICSSLPFIGNGEVAPTGKEDSSEFWSSVSPTSSESSHISSLQLLGSHPFPINAPTLTLDTLQGWEFSLHVIQPVVEWNSECDFQQFQPCGYRR